MVQHDWFIANMERKELLEEYSLLCFQLYGRTVGGSHLTNDQLQQEVHCMYAQFPAVPNLTKES